MRKIVLLAAMLVVPAIAAPPAEAGDRRHGFHSAPPHFSHHRHFQPRHFAPRGSVTVFKFHSGNLGFRRGPPVFVRPPHVWRPPVWRPHVWRPHHRAPVLTFGRHPHPAPGRGFAPHWANWRGSPHHR